MNTSIRNNSRTDGGGRIVRGTILARSESLRRFSDAELLSGLATAHGEERAVQLEIILYLIEVERRQLYLAKGYGSLFEFCMDTYHYSRTTAWRRISAARCVGKFPRVGEMILTGELDLTMISMLSGILTRENSTEILAWVSGKSFREFETLVARHRPEKIIRDRIKPVFVMSPGTVCGTRAPSVPDVGCASREQAVSPAGGNGKQEYNAPGAQEFAHATSRGDIMNCSFNVETDCSTGSESNSSIGKSFPGSSIMDDSGGKSCAGQPERVLVEQKYKLEFAVDPEFINKLNRVKALNSAKFPKGIGLEELFGLVMDEYLDRHEPDNKISRRNARRERKNRKNERLGNKKSFRGPNAPREITERTRHIPRSVRDAVFKRDGGRCSFIGPDGKRCGSRWNLEIDHIIPYARGGDSTRDNLRLLCAAHNRLAAERTYGKDFMERYYRRE